MLLRFFYADLVIYLWIIIAVTFPYFAIKNILFASSVFLIFGLIIFPLFCIVSLLYAFVIIFINKGVVKLAAKYNFHLNIKRSKRTRTLAIVYELFLSIAFYITYFNVPFDWHVYESNNPAYPFSFAYPKDFVVTTCANGDIVVAKTKVSRCEEIGIASISYLHNLYFQVFLPRNHSLVDISYIKKNSQFETWQAEFNNFSNSGFPIHSSGNLIPTTKGIRNTAPNQFMVGYFTDSPKKDEIEQIIYRFNFPE